MGVGLADVAGKDLVASEILVGGTCRLVTTTTVLHLT